MELNEYTELSSKLSIIVDWGNSNTKIREKFGFLLHDLYWESYDKADKHGIILRDSEISCNSLDENQTLGKWVQDLAIIIGFLNFNSIIYDYRGNFFICKAICDGYILIDQDSLYFKTYSEINKLIYFEKYMIKL
jgi:hypothetical protein